MDIRVVDEDTLILHSDYSDYHNAKIGLYHNGVNHTIAGFGKKDIYRVSISENGLYAYFAVEYEPSDVYRASLVPPYDYEQVLDNFSLTEIAASPDGSSLAIAVFNSVHIFNYATKQTEKITDANTAYYSKVIWK